MQKTRLFIHRPRVCPLLAIPWTGWYNLRKELRGVVKRKKQHPVFFRAICPDVYKRQVLLWQIVTVPLLCSRSMAIGLPTMLLRPITTHSLPWISISCERSSSMMPAGVQGRKWKLPIMMRPTLEGWNASTSFSGTIASTTASSSKPFGSGD